MRQVHGLLPVPWYHDICTVQFSLLFMSCVHEGNLVAMPKSLLLSVCPALVITGKVSCLLRRASKEVCDALNTNPSRRVKSKRASEDFCQSSGLYIAARPLSLSEALGPPKKNQVHPETGMVLGGFAILIEKELGKKGYQLQKAIVKTGVGK